MKLKRYFVYFLATFAFALLLPVTGAASDYNFTVVFKSDTLPENASDIVENAGARIISKVPEIGMMRIEGPFNLLESLGSDPDIQAISPSVRLSLPSESQITFDPIATFDTSGAWLYEFLQWDIKQVTNDGESFDIWPGSHQTVVAVLDTGINTQHQDLVINLLGGRNFVPDPDSEVVDPDDYEDQHGHGSHCAGAIGGNGLILGVGPNLGIKAYRVLDGNGGGMMDWIVNGMITAANDGVDVISMSLGGYASISGLTLISPSLGIEVKLKGGVADFLAYRRAAQYVASKGVVLVVAAGNDATNITNPNTVSKMMSDKLNEIFEELGIDLRIEYRGASMSIPGTVAGTVTVSATGPYDDPASYTNYGPGVIDLSAPGGDAISDPIQLTELCLSAYRTMDGNTNTYALMTGTSMATPKVAAVAALIIDQAKANGESLNSAQVVTRLQQSAIDAGKIGNDEYYGFGMVNAISALQE